MIRSRKASHVGHVADGSYSNGTIQASHKVELIAVIALFILKWQPYCLRAVTAAANHSIGSSIVTGAARPLRPPRRSKPPGTTPAPIFLAIWQAVVLGLLLAVTIEWSSPRDLLGRLPRRVLVLFREYVRPRPGGRRARHPRWSVSRRVTHFRFCVFAHRLAAACQSADS